MTSKIQTISVIALLSLLLLACGTKPEERAADTAPPVAAPQSIAGQWDVTVQGPTGAYPSWFELVEKDGALSGRFVGRVGSARPIAQAHWNNNELHIQLPVQYEKHPKDMEFTGKLEGERLAGATNAEDGSTLQWSAVRVPVAAARPEPISWAEPIQLFNGKDTTGWKLRHAEGPNGWKVQKGLLVNNPPSVDLVSEQTLQDFKLHAEFQIAEKSNSGIYLRGRYEVQIQDDFGKDPSSILMGGVYGFLTPSEMAAKKAGEWQTYDITLVGRKVTIVLNGRPIIDGEIAGVTGGALDSNEGQPGPIFLQGDHGKVTFRKIEVTPAK
ncbi:MAG: 3-keto-disaccharide hydrolase [Acidobacteriota bacterium]